MANFATIGPYQGREPIGPGTPAISPLAEDLLQGSVEESTPPWEYLPNPKGFGQLFLQGLPGLLGGFGTILKSPRTYFRGINPGSKLRIPTVFPAAEGKLWVATKPESARLYGSKLLTFEAPPGTNVLEEGTREFGKLTGRRSNRPLLNQLRKGETFIDAADDAISRASTSGYDVVQFLDDSGVGSVVLNPSKLLPK